MSYKDTNIANTGTATQYGADDMELYARNFNGQIAGLPAVTIKNQNKWTFWDGIFAIRNQGDTWKVNIRGPSNNPGADFDLSLPPIVANDTLASIGLAQTWTQKQRYNAGIVFPEQSTPGLPGSGLHNVFVATNGHLQKINNSGVVKDYDLTAATVPADMKDSVLALRDYNVRCFKVSTTYYAVKFDSTLVASGSTAETVLAAAFALEGEILIDGTWDLSGAFTGFTITSDTHIRLTSQATIRVPQAYASYLFRITESNVSIIGKGSLKEQGTPSRNWIAIQLGLATSADAIENITIDGLYVFQASVGIRINQGSTGFIRSSLFKDIFIDDSKVGVDFDAATADKTSNNVFENVIVKPGGSTTDGFKDVAGIANTFVGCICHAFGGGVNEMTISSLGDRTQIYGGSCTGISGLFTDAGTDTYIDDAIHAEFKLKGTALSPSQITSNQDNYNPTGWNEKVNTLRLNTDASRDITGLVPGANPKNRVVVIENIGSNSIVLKNDITSTAANRFLFGNDITLGANNSVAIYYDTVSSRWRSFNNFAVVGSGAALLAAANIFTEPQTIFKNQALLLTLYRDSKVVADGIELWFDAEDSGDVQQNYGRLRYEIDVNTAGSETGHLEVSQVIAGTNTQVLSTSTVGSLVLEKGLALENSISPSQITSDQNNYNPTGLQESDTIRLDADSNFRTISGITAPSPDVSKVLRLINISNNTILLTNQDAGSSAANRFAFKGYDLPLFPNKEIVLKYDKTLDRWVCEDLHAHVIPPAGAGFYYRHDMMGTVADSVVSSMVQGTGAANSVSAVTSVAGHPGVIQHQTGTTTTGSATFGTTNFATILLGNNWYWRFECMIRIPTLSDGTNRFGVQFGFIDNLNVGAVIDGVYAMYQDNINTGKWILRALDNSVTTTASDTGTAVAANQWYKLVVTVHPGGAEARLYVDGAEIAASISSGIPTGAGRGTGFGTQIFKSLGTTSRNCDIDYIEVIGYSNVVV